MQPVLRITISALPTVNGSPVWKSEIEFDEDLGTEELRAALKVAQSSVRMWSERFTSHDNGEQE